ncbi:hypothetical protein SLE2022_279640 [Rubroshorea leprosula]
MGLFTLTAAGGGFILIGGSEFLGSLNLTQNSDPSSPPNQAIKTDPVSSSLSFVFISIFSCVVFFDSLVSISDAFSSKDGVGSALQLQVLAISMLFFLYSLLGLFGDFKNSFSLHSSILDMVLLFAFVEEFLLFYLQRKDPSGIENRYFDLLLVPILICVVSTVLELRSKKSNFPRLIRGAGLILHGTWFVQMGLSFYTSMMAYGCSLHEKSRANYTVKCKGHSEYHRGRAIATLQFNCHLALLVVFVVSLYSIMVKRNGLRKDFTQYRPLGEEMRQMENVEHFTLDSDEDLDNGIKEEEDLEKEKATDVALNVNGHASY